MSAASLKNARQVIDTYVNKIIVFSNKVEVQLNFFSDFSLKLDEKEKDCPVTESAKDLQRQSLSCLISKNVIVQLYSFLSEKSLGVQIKKAKNACKK
ncbi:MAG: hypothetical protein RR716_06305 [Christensenellaceae bacterium]